MLCAFDTYNKDYLLTYLLTYFHQLSVSIFSLTTTFTTTITAAAAAFDFCLTSYAGSPEVLPKNLCSLLMRDFYRLPFTQPTEQCQLSTHWRITHLSVKSS